MRISVNGTMLYVDVEGAELRVTGGALVSRPTLVALHGGPGFDSGYLRPGLGPLSSHTQVVYVDLRGQGRSLPAEPASCTLEQMADDVAALCRTPGITHPVVFGHSAGGFVALHLALRQPGLLRGLILCDTAPTLLPIADDNPSPTLAERTRSPEAVAVAGRLFSGDFSEPTMAAFGRLVAPYYASPRHPQVPGALLSLSHFAAEVARYFFQVLAPTYDVRPRLAEIGVPALVLVGAYDWICPPAGSRLMARSVPRATLIEFADAGHFPFSEEPAAFAQAVESFLMELEGRPIGLLEQA